MKFAAFALVAFASTTAAFPTGFVEQCCGRFVNEDYCSQLNPEPGCVDLLPGAERKADFIASMEALVSGKNDLLCLSDTAAGETGGDCGDVPCKLIDETYCVSLATLCVEHTYLDFDYNGVVLESDDLLCCPDIDPYCESSTEKDNPWTCATRVGWFSETGGSGPTVGLSGFYCGRTDGCKGFGVVCGDPHFQTFSGDWYDFHGECDLDFMSVPSFGKGLGMDIQIRTKARYEYSYIEQAVIKIGDSTLEVSAYGSYIFNGVDNADMTGAKMADQFEITHEIRDAQHHIFTIYTGVEKNGKAESVVIKTFKDLVAVKMDNTYYQTFGKATGMMGDFMEGKMLARDGKTLIEDPIEFGMEWQAKENLFSTPSPVTGKCVMPSKDASAERRRLGETVPLEAAVAACEAVDAVHHENCVYDVMATGDLEIAHAGVF